MSLTRSLFFAPLLSDARAVHHARRVARRPGGDRGRPGCGDWGLGQERKGHDHEHDHGDIHERCAAACSDCEKESNQGFHHCYKQVQAGKPGHAKAMHLCVDCGEVCSTAAKLVARMSPLMTFTCHACAESCDARIAECEKLGDAEIKDEGGRGVAAEMLRVLRGDGQGDGRRRAREVGLP